MYVLEIRAIIEMKWCITRAIIHCPHLTDPAHVNVVRTFQSHPTAKGVDSPILYRVGSRQDLNPASTNHKPPYFYLI